jgi:outer membrane biosynthesis protein TonB
MRKALSSTVMAASILALASVETPDAQARQQCSAAMPSSKHSYWSYRLIDGRKCWYEGKPGLSKDLLEWPREANPREARQEPKEEPKREPKPDPKQEARQAPKQEARLEPRQTPKQEARQEVKQEAAETLGDEEAFAPPALRAKPDRVAEKPRSPLDAQAWAVENAGTFEAIWRERIQNQNLR